MSLEVRALREDEREACLDLWCTVWPGERARLYFRRYFYGDVEWLPYYTQVAALDGRLVSAVQICRRVVACGDYLLTMGGIANVATLPEHRGQGYNTECLRRAVSVMEADAMDFSLLFTGINAYYARLGYETLRRNGVEVILRADFAPRPTPYAARPATDADLPAIRGLYDAFNRHRPIAVQRTEAYWRDWIGISPGHVPENLYVAADAGGRVRGYVQSGVFRSAVPYSAGEAGARVIEFGIAPERGEAREEAALCAALVDAVAAQAAAAGGRQLRLDVALEPALLRALEEIAESRTMATVSSGMARLLHRTNLLQSVAMGLNERWIAAGRPGGALTFTTPYGPIRLDANGAFLRVDAAEEEAGTLSQAALFGLLFGALTPEAATNQTSLHPLLAALFPLRAPVYWGADGF
jgi:hypothetical protein